MIKCGVIIACKRDTDTYIHIHTYIHTYMHITHVCVCICMYMYVSTCICLYYMYVHASACIGMYLAVYVCICMYELVCIFWRWLKVPPKIQSSWRLQGGKFSVQKENKAGIKCLWQSWSLNTCLPSHMSLYLPLSHCGFIQIWSNVVLL